MPGLVVTLALALVLRLNDFTSAPAIADNGDEFDWAWMGLGIIRHGVPYGWSNLRVYPPGTPVTLNGRYFEIVHPFLDHPPVFGLIVGAAAWLQGARDFTDVTMQMIRPVPILLSIVTLYLAYLLGRRVLGAAPAMLGAIILATAPAAVLVQRQVEAESLLAPLLLGSLLLVGPVDRDDRRRGALAALLACCALAPLVKVPGVTVAVLVAAVLIARGRWRPAAAALAAGVAGTAIFFAYGALLDGQLFAHVLAGSQGRRSGVLGVYHFIVSPAGPGGAIQQLRDGWWLLGWLAVAVAALSGGDRRVELLAWPVIGYAVVIMLFAEHVSYYGWFRVSVYPLVYLLAGWFTWRAAREPSAFGLLLVACVGGATALNAVFAAPGAESWAPNPYAVIAVLALVALPGLITLAGAGEPRVLDWSRKMAMAAVALAITANIVASAQLTTIFRAL
ncbi:MAG: glycosyltransferase family 39 protein [Candidatus Dormibacteria bacterium]